MNLIIGDSHIRSLQWCKSHNNIFREYRASSVRGLINKNSNSGARNKILDLVNSLDYKKLFIMFGKVDIEWVYPYKLKKETIELNNFIEDTTDKYIQFISEISDSFEEIYVLGIHLPALEEDDMLSHLNRLSAIESVSSKSFMQKNLNKIKHIGSLKQRTEETITFNNILYNKVKDKKWNYMDVTHELMDEKTNTCKKFFISHQDHHLNENKVGMVWHKKIESIL
tara:strand:- start:1674 stop:2348 length:675 start_codon:yes stop_codon:yes gene_type:complete